MVEIYILGSGTCVPSPRRGAPGVAVRLDGETMLFDSGSGTLDRLMRAGLDYKELDHLFYTHSHVDHTADLIPLLFALKNTPAFARTKKLGLWGSNEFLEFFARLDAIYGKWIHADSYVIAPRELPPDGVRLSGGRVIARPVRHQPGSLGYRVEALSGKVFALSGDTDYCAELVRLSEKADLLVLECSTPDAYKAEGHLSPAFAGRIAREARARKLVLTHMYPICDDWDLRAECQKEFDGEVVIAEDLMSFLL